VNPSVSRHALGPMFHSGSENAQYGAGGHLHPSSRLYQATQQLVVTICSGGLRQFGVNKPVARAEDEKCRLNSAWRNRRSHTLPMFRCCYRCSVSTSTELKTLWTQRGDAAQGRNDRGVSHLLLGLFYIFHLLNFPGN
jgi:hypothetical protein